MTTENLTESPPGDTATVREPGVAMLTAAMELQALARGRDPVVEPAPAQPEPLTRLLAFGFAFSVLLAVALIVEIVTA